MRPNNTVWDVVVVGGGISGSTAGLYLRRAGLRVLLLDRGKTSLGQCAFLENYPGYPAGIGVRTFLELVHAQTEAAGCERLRERVVSLGRREGLYEVETREGETHRAARVLVATVYDVGYLRALREAELTGLLDENGIVRPEKVDTHGRCGIPGLYIVSPQVGYESQAVISAGFAARVALGIQSELREEEGMWPALARGVHWRVCKGTYGSDRWRRDVEAYFRSTVPEDCELNESRVEEMIERKIEELLAFQVPRSEARRLDKEAQLELLRRMDEDVIEAYLAERG